MVIRIYFIGILVLLAFSFFSVNSALAAVIGTTNDAMTIGGGARPIGMGRAFTALADDANPAGLAALKGPQAMAMYTNLLGEVYYDEFSGAVPTPYGTFGLGYITTGVTGIQTNDTPAAIPAGTATWGRRPVLAPTLARS